MILQFTDTYNRINQILENQEAILLALSTLITPMSTKPHIAEVNNSLIDNYHETRKILGKDYVER